MVLQIFKTSGQSPIYIQSKSFSVTVTHGRMDVKTAEGLEACFVDVIRSRMYDDAEFLQLHPLVQGLDFRFVGELTPSDKDA